jgi:hypothetical protein
MNPSTETATWAARAERLLKQALEETRDGADAIPTVLAALTVLRIEASELSPDDVDGFPFRVRRGAVVPARLSCWSVAGSVVAARCTPRSQA